MFEIKLVKLTNHSVVAAYYMGSLCMRGRTKDEHNFHHRVGWKVNCSKYLTNSVVSLLGLKLFVRKHIRIGINSACAYTIDKGFIYAYTSTYQTRKIIQNWAMVKHPVVWNMHRQICQFNLMVKETQGTYIAQDCFSGSRLCIQFTLIGLPLCER